MTIMRMEKSNISKSPGATPGEGAFFQRRYQSAYGGPLRESEIMTKISPLKKGLLALAY